METNKKHTPTPWRLIKGTKEKLSKIKKGKYTLELQGYGYEQEKEIKDAEFIVTACNSYEALKQQNEELIEQTTKLQADKDRLAEQLKEELSFLQSEYKSADIKKLFAVGSFMHNRITKITETLSECGYNI